MTRNARSLRRNATDAERCLWQLLSLYRPRFTRQHPVGRYILDLACRSVKLAIEIDGSQHVDNARDDERTTFLEGLGWKVIRFWNSEVAENPDGVAERIIEEVAARLQPTPPPAPPCLQGGEEMRSIAEASRAVLLTAEPAAKIRAARAAARAWHRGGLAHVFNVAMPDRPARPAEPVLMPANRMPKRGKAGSERSRIAMLHALAHIEFGAIDLAFDMAGRFGAGMPRAFIDDWIGVGADEAMHFALLERRLRTLGAHYGALPAHDGLWEAAGETAHDLLARLAVVPMVLEARGLDVTPALTAAFERAGDARSAAILGRVYRDEIRHVAVGTRWFETACESRGFPPVAHWQDLIRAHFRGVLKPPFNDSARGQAGLSREYYSGLAAPEHV